MALHFQTATANAVKGPLVAAGRNYLAPVDYHKLVLPDSLLLQVALSKDYEPDYLHNLVIDLVDIDPHYCNYPIILIHSINDLYMTHYLKNVIYLYSMLLFS